MDSLLPREKMMRLGATSLSNEELLALILGSGCQKCNVFDLSRKLSNFLSENTNKPSLDTLLKIQGLGKVKATQVLACLELSARYILSEKSAVIHSPEDLAPRLSFLKYEPQEHMVLVSLNSANNIIQIHDISVGLVNQTPVHPREAFVKAIEDRSVSVIFAHNHPSGDTEPSFEDLEMTRILCASGKILQIPVKDHIIIGKRGWTSIGRKYPDLFSLED